MWLEIVIDDDVLDDIPLLECCNSFALLVDEPV